MMADAYVNHNFNTFGYLLGDTLTKYSVLKQDPIKEAEDTKKKELFLY